MLLESLEKQGCFATGIVTEENGKYRFARGVTESEIVETAKTLLSRRVLQTIVIENVQIAQDFFITQLAALNAEVFCVAFLNTKHRVIACEQMFQGTLDIAPVYPREVVHRAVMLNAAAVIFAHNHPSGDATPSQADIQMTQQLVEALSLFDIHVLDHFVIGGADVVSFAQQGLLRSAVEKRANRLPK